MDPLAWARTHQKEALAAGGVAAAGLALLMRSRSRSRSQQQSGSGSATAAPGQIPEFSSLNTDVLNTIQPEIDQLYSLLNGNGANSTSTLNPTNPLATRSNGPVRVSGLAGRVGAQATYRGGSRATVRPKSALQLKLEALTPAQKRDFQAWTAKASANARAASSRRGR